MKSPALRALSLSTIVCLASASVGQAPLANPVQPPPDLVVYGATAAGVFAAYSAAREGLHVVLLELGEHVGGMVTGGLSGTDLGDSSVIGGYVREFYKQAAAHYGLRDLAQPENWKTEPHVDEAIFRQMLRDAGVQVRFHKRLRKKSGVTSHGHRIASITTQDGSSWPAKVFADCSYEGELMAQVGVKYTWGREGSQQYGESLAGVVEHTWNHQFKWPLSAYDQNHHLLPEIDPGPLAAPGTGDRKVQSYNFRLILTNDPLNRLPFPQPTSPQPDSGVWAVTPGEYKSRAGEKVERLVGSCPDTMQFRSGIP
jgi:choline dehydrogenase-like flavoprotein